MRVRQVEKRKIKFVPFCVQRDTSGISLKTNPECENSRDNDGNASSPLVIMYTHGGNKYCSVTHSCINTYSSYKRPCRVPVPDVHIKKCVLKKCRSYSKIKTRPCPILSAHTFVSRVRAPGNPRIPVVCFITRLIRMKKKKKKHPILLILCFRRREIRFYPPRAISRPHTD